MGAGHRSTGFSPATERVLLTFHRRAEPAGRVHGGASGPQNEPQPRSRAGYDSPVCSNKANAIDRITAAIDQLASDIQDATGGASVEELTARVAALWQMLSDLDPDLARRAQRYTGPADGDPSD